MSFNNITTNFNQQQATNKQSLSSSFKQYSNLDINSNLHESDQIQKMNNYLSISPSMIDYHSNLLLDNNNQFQNGSISSYSHLNYHHHNNNNNLSPINKNNQINSTNGIYLNDLNEFSNNRVSAFLPLEEIISNDEAGSKHEIVSRIFTDVYSQEGNIDNLIRIISFHPDFLKEFINFSNFLMYGQHGALPYDSRHFIAIMASTRHKCIYLIKQQEREFILQNGNKSWLSGLDHIPEKLKDLNELNKLLCHQPWLITHEHIEKILKSQYSWTVTELMMAVTILTHFHALSGFVFGCGINENYMQQIEMQEKKLNEEIEKKRREEEIRQKLIAEFQLKKMSQNDDDDDFNEQDDQSDYDDNLGYEDDEFIFNNNHNSRTSRANYRNLNNSDSIYRTRSDSTGTGNRTLSNSSASSCELGIDMLLKEMQMIKAEDNKISKEQISNSQKYSSSASSKSSSSLFINKPNTSSYQSSSYLNPNSSSSSSLNNNHQNYLNYNNHNLLLSGTNSPVNNHLNNSTSSIINNYLSDLSNTNQHYLNNRNCLHDNNNNQISNDIETNSNVLNVINNANLAFNSNQSNDDLDSDSEDCVNQKVIKNAKKKCSNLNTNNMNGSSLKSKKLALNENAPVSSTNFNKLIEKVKLYIRKYEYEPTFTYSDFETTDQSLRLEYYTWENQGYCTALSLSPDICEYLDKTFKIAVNMTYNTMGNLKDVDTSLFRRAVWHYIHSLFGVRYDDYDYNQIRILLKSPLRKYIKILCSCPERITKAHYDSIMKEFTHSEKVHVNIVIMEARIQASMLYFLRAINSYFG